MVTITTESGIEFSFPEDWNPIEYDKCEPYHTKIMPLQGSCAVDFLCRKGKKVIFMEVMRFKEKPLDNPQNVVDKIGSQVKDTVFGLSMFHMQKEQTMEKYTRPLFVGKHRKRSPKLIAFIEIDSVSGKLQPDKVKADILDKLRKRFVPLGFAVRVHDSKNIAKTPWDAKVI